MDVDYELGGNMRISLNKEDLGSLAMREFCTIRLGLCGHDSKTWIRHERFITEPRAVIDGDGDLNVDIPPDQQIPFEIAKNAISASNGDQEMVEWYFHDGSVIEVV